MTEIRRDFEQEKEAAQPGLTRKQVAPTLDNDRNGTRIQIAGSSMQPIDDKHPVPIAPVSVADTGLTRELLLDLTLKLAHTVGQFTTSWMADQLMLTVPVVNELLEDLTSDGLIETLGASGFLNYRFSSTQAGRERAAELMELCGHVGPAPVPLEDYVSMIATQNGARDQINLRDVQSAMQDLVLEEDAAKIAGMAISSGRSLFLFGPAGNGKTTLAKRLHNALSDEIWIPHCVSAYNNIIQLFDPKWHRRAKTGRQAIPGSDRRWARIERPLIVAGGEMTMDSVELTFHPKLRYYEAPLHIKANGGTFLVDDFGRHQGEPTKLLNRWIVPLEEGADYLELNSGQKISVPFGMMLIVATNLEPDSIVDPAFLRRMGYRLRLSGPSWQRFQTIFRQYALSNGLEINADLMQRLGDRFRVEGRELRCCQPRDLIQRVQDVCLYAGKPVELTWENLDVAWRGYFGNWSQAEYASQ